MKEYILEIKKLLPPKICQKVISYFDNNYDDAKFGGEIGATDKNVRNCLTRSILNPKTFGEKLCSNAIKEKIFESVDHYKKHYNIKIDKISQLDILKYEHNNYEAGYKFHQDIGLGCSDRQFSISICLNNEFKGGEFVFDLPSGHFVVSQNVGDVVMFPSNFMFPHQVNKITEGTRYALIGWVI